ncbi:hypothetical protein LTR37_002407 [Vermiconidia calcicola]|uniref:Uncharacterized protein n=1 Tax=Vermiconidia calcicola TaxID=1690605 RepID=A0ACC3NSQ4_9PEZI|nr:hypothetical protein LTR37_002407 [Vermiconidia calcicola]
MILGIALIFDLMETCLDWQSSITPVLRRAMYATASDQGPADSMEANASILALEWRQGFFDEIHSRSEAGEPLEDIDATHERAQRRLLAQPKWQSYSSLADEAVNECVTAWHKQKGTISIVDSGIHVNRS